jgi:transposase InsO family protein
VAKFELIIFLNRGHRMRHRQWLPALLRDLGVVQKHSKPNRSATCGKAERFQQTLKKWLTAHPRQPQTVARLQPFAAPSSPTTTAADRTASLNRQSSLAAYQARPKAGPPASADAEPQARVRCDIIDSSVKLTPLRHIGRLHHIGIGRTPS